jgi:hypothetical protein
MTVRLLHQLGNLEAGAVIEMDDRRARRLESLGYVTIVADPKPEKK